MEDSFGEFENELRLQVVKQRMFVRATVFLLWVESWDDDESECLTEHDFVDLLKEIPETRALLTYMRPDLWESTMQAVFMLMDANQGGSLDYEELHLHSQP